MAEGHVDVKRYQIISLLYIVFICFSVINIKMSVLDSNIWTIKSFQSLIKEEEKKVVIGNQVVLDNLDTLNTLPKAQSYLSIRSRLAKSYLVVDGVLKYVDEEFVKNKTTLLKQFNSRTLIDNALMKISVKNLNSLSGILLHEMSDHLPYFITLNMTTNNTNTNKYIQIRENNTENYSQFKIKFELAGTLTNFFANQFNAEVDQYNNKKILGLAYSQYFKTEFNYIKHWAISSNSTFAFRGYYGIAIPFGNSDNIPFSKSFFSGGSNDNRAWEVYRLGPGSSGAISEFNEANMKIAFNIEYRFGLFGKLDGAIFTDIGNIWNVFDDTQDPKRTFNGLKDLNELAIGTGFGVRYNVGYFVLRLDMGLKAYNPVLDSNDRWMTDFKLNKAVFNIGLNYPF